MSEDRCFSNPNKYETSSDRTKQTKQKTIFKDIVNQVQTNFIKSNGVKYNENFGLHNQCLAFAKSYDLLLDVTKGKYYTKPVEDSNWTSNEAWSAGLYSVDYSANNVKTVVDTSYNAGNSNQIIFPMTQPAELADISWNGLYPGVRVDPSYNIFYNECDNENYWREKLVDMSFNTTNYSIQSKQQSEKLYGMVYPGNVTFILCPTKQNIVYVATAGGLSISFDNGNTFTNKTVANTNNGILNNNMFGVYAIGSTVYAATTGGLSISFDNGVTFTNKTIADGLGNNAVRGVYAIGSTIYAATGGGLSISFDNGVTFTNKTVANTNNEIVSNNMFGVYAIGSTIYAATTGGLSISTNNGTTFTTRTTANSGLGSNIVIGVYAISSTIYAATFNGGLSISTNNGTTFTTRTVANSQLGNDSLQGVYAIGSTIYAATAGGLSISINNGTTFTNKTVADGLGNNIVQGVYATGSTIYAATADGLSISIDNGTTFTTKTTVNGLGSNNVRGVYEI
jgi:hypothetical protein